jgi:hypothetical protein
MRVRVMRISKGDDTSPVGHDRISRSRCRVSRGRCGISCGRFARISKFRDVTLLLLLMNSTYFSEVSVPTPESDLVKLFPKIE